MAGLKKRIVRFTRSLVRKATHVSALANYEAKRRIIKMGILPGKLPDFLIIGAQKCGTTSLLHALRAHPDVFMARGRGGNPTEVHFFDRDIHRGRDIEHYKSFFPWPRKLQGEKTPEYIFDRRAHELMSQYVPKAKLILMLRNPADRAYSQWNHYNQIYDRSKAWGWVKTSFEQALEVDREIVERGEYIDQIENLLRYFPREQLFVGVAERFSDDVEPEYRRLYGFLGLDVPSRITREWRHRRRYDQPMTQETRRRLLEHYQKFNNRLFDFLGYRIEAWDQ